MVTTQPFTVLIVFLILTLCSHQILTEHQNGDHSKIHLDKRDSLTSSPSLPSIVSHRPVKTSKDSIYRDKPKNPVYNKFNKYKDISPAKVYTDLDERPCDKFFCPFGAACVVDKKTGKPFCKCLSTCTVDVFAPVCGSDNITYSSECQLKLASCNQRTTLFVKHPGECRK